jgi:dCMP deaminase
MERPSRELTNIRIAQIISERGTCARLKVGAVITEDNKIISTGYNGPAKDEPHCSSEICNQSEGCQRSVHAEMNAIINAGIEDDIVPPLGLMGDRVIYCTTQPCQRCATEIWAARIQTVYFMHPYRNQDGLKFLLINGINVYQIDNEGNTKQINNL